jgi:hypothetical protein
MFCDFSKSLNRRWPLEEFRARVAAVRACGGRGNFHLLVGALQVHLDNKMQIARFMKVLEDFVREREHGHIAESDAGSDAGSDTEVDSDSPNL